MVLATATYPADIVRERLTSNCVGNMNVLTRLCAHPRAIIVGKMKGFLDIEAVADMTLQSVCALPFSQLFFHLVSTRFQGNVWHGVGLLGIPAM